MSMLKVLAFAVVLAAAGAGGWLFTVYETPDAATNRLFVDAQRLINLAGSASVSEKPRLLKQARDQLKSIVDKYPTTNLAVQLISGQSIGTVSIAKIDEAAREASWTLCKSTLPDIKYECILDYALELAKGAPGTLLNVQFDAAKAYAAHGQDVRAQQVLDAIPLREAQWYLTKIAIGKSDAACLANSAGARIQETVQSNPAIDFNGFINWLENQLSQKVTLEEKKSIEDEIVYALIACDRLSEAATAADRFKSFRGFGEPIAQAQLATGRPEVAIKTLQTLQSEHNVSAPWIDALLGRAQALAGMNVEAEGSFDKALSKIKMADANAPFLLANVAQNQAMAGFSNAGMVNLRRAVIQAGTTPSHANALHIFDAFVELDDMEGARRFASIVVKDYGGAPDVSKLLRKRKIGIAISIIEEIPKLPLRASMIADLAVAIK